MKDDPSLWRIRRINLLRKISRSRSSRDTRVYVWTMYMCRIACHTTLALYPKTQRRVFTLCHRVRDVPWISLWLLARGSKQTFPSFRSENYSSRGWLIRCRDRNAIYTHCESDIVSGKFIALQKHVARLESLVFFDPNSCLQTINYHINYMVARSPL